MTKSKYGPIRSDIASMEDDTISVRGYDLSSDLMGKIDAAALYYLEVTGK